MRRNSCLLISALLGLLTAGLITCGGSNLTIQDTCNQVMAAMCERESACGTLGSQTVADCTKTMQANNCSGSSALACPAGTTFQSSQAQKCIDDQKSQSCTDLANGVEPAGCLLVCSAGGTGGTGGTGGLGALDACHQTMAILCQKTSTCLGSTGLSELGYTSVESCTTGMQSSGCADVTQTTCGGGTTYHADQAQPCLSGLTNLSCTDFTNNNLPSACNSMCQ